MGTHTAHGTDRIPHRGTTTALALHASASSAHALTTLEQRLDSALVAVPEHERPVRPRQLSWNGVRVSEELQHYAACVASGAQLAPYRGPVLARSEAVFPWDLEATSVRAQRRRLDRPWSVWQVAVLALLFAGVVFGGGVSLLADSDGAELPLWSTAMLEPRVEAAPRAVEPEPERIDTATAPVVASSARAKRAARTQPASVKTRSASPTRAPVRAPVVRARESQPASVTAASASDEPTLFVDAPSF
jgi:hypothetical protein